jgi:hypothetical protein
LRNAEDEIRRKLPGVAKMETFWRRIVGRFETDDRENLFEQMARAKLDEVEARKAMLDQAIAAHKGARELLKRYSFKHDASQRAGSAGTPTLMREFTFIFKQL